MWAERMGRVGIWTGQLDTQPGAEAERSAAELEAMGYRSVWIPEAIHREVLTHATALLGATSRLVVATGIARIHARSAQATALAQRFLAGRHPGRFVLGLGVSHPLVVERVLGQRYERPVETMRRYLDAIDAARGGERLPPDAAPRVLAALGPRMLRLAAERSAGAHTYLAPAAHTAWARETLGPDAFLAPSIKVLLDDDHDDPWSVARACVARPLSLPGYAANLARFGFGSNELGNGPAERVVDALVAIGNADRIVDRVREHLDAGADHVCVEVLTGDEKAVPLDGWRRLAPALTAVV